MISIAMVPQGLGPNVEEMEAMKRTFEEAPLPDFLVNRMMAK
jgi:hypothetical protein